MRFELSNSPPPHLNRRLQLRMLGFVGLIGLVMFSMALFRPKQENKLPGDPNAAVQPDESIFQVKEGKSELKEGEFVSEPWQEPPPAGTGSAESLEQEVQRLETHLDKSILRRVKDNELGIRRDEADAYYRVLEHARRMPTRDLERSGATDVLYINLMTQPDRFRGDPITIQGDLWRLYEFEAGPNPYGFKTLYEAWIFTGDSSNHPYRVVFSRLPRDLEPGENLRKSVRATGYFFKREGYASNTAARIIPVKSVKVKECSALERYCLASNNRVAVVESLCSISSNLPELMDAITALINVDKPEIHNPRMINPISIG